MEIAVLSDVHSNYIALERCLDYAFSRNIDTFIFLGDYIGELAYPERTMKILYELNDKYRCYCIKGNKEEYWIDYRVGGEKGWKDKDSTTGALLYAYNLLSSYDMSFFAQLPFTKEIEVDEMPSITLCHGSPYRITEKMLADDDRTIEIMNSMKDSTILCGHTHVQRKIVHKQKSVFNPGSVGMPMCSDGKTQFMILHGYNGIWSEEFISLEYDVDKVIHEIHESKLDKHAPYWSLITEYILRGGKKTHADILIRAMELCKEERGECIWPDIPEKYWAMAVDEQLNKL